MPKLPRPKRVDTTFEPTDRPTDLANTALDALKASEQYQSGDRVIIMVLEEQEDAHVGGLVIHGYSTDEMRDGEPVTDLLLNASALNEGLGGPAIHYRPGRRPR